MKHIIWSSDIDLNDWDLEEICEEANLDVDDIEGIEDYIYDLNDEYLEDEKANFNIEVPEGLVIFGDAGRWNGRSKGIVRFENNIAKCFNNPGYWDTMTIGIDDDDDLVIIGRHHDGTDYYTIRKWKSEDLKAEVIELIESGDISPSEAIRYTDSVADLIKDVYGWS